LAPSLRGAVRTILQNPAFGTRLLQARASFFRNRSFTRKLPTPDGYEIETSNELIAYWSFFVEREGWAIDWVDSLRRERKPVVLDVGANAGVFSHWIWTLQPATRLIAFEPLPKMAEKLRRWKSRTGADLTLHETAVSDRSGTAEFFISADDDTTASLKDTGSKQAVISVPIKRLDDLVEEEALLLIKIDVEGCEPEVLAGGKQTIRKARFLLIEAHTAEALDAIQAQLGQGWRHRRVGASDHLFIREI
jgi:FkbM family methyltransferase